MTKKKIYILILIIIIVGLGLGVWFYFGRTKLPIYESVILTPNDLVQTVNVTGRVKSDHELALAFKRSGQVTEAPVTVGQSVGAGALLLKLDTADEARAVNEVTLALASAKLAREKLLNPIDRRSTDNELKQAYEDGLATAALVYANLAAIVDSLDNIFFGEDLSNKTNIENIDYYIDVIDYYDLRFKNVPNELKTAYHQIEDAYAPAFAAYQRARSGGNEAVVEQAILTTADLVQATVNVIKIGRDTVQFFKDKSIIDNWQPNQPTVVDGHLASLSTYYSTIHGFGIDLLKTTNTIKTEHSIIDVSGIDLASADLEIKQKESSLANAQARLADSYLRAPFSAIVTEIKPEIGEIITANSPVVSLISSEPLILEVNIPEADVAKIKIGDPAQVTLDAYGDDVIFDARIVSVDPAATIIDGVATYRTVAHFLKVDERIKSGLTAELEITTATREQVFALPERAVTRRNGVKTVRIVRQGALNEVAVETGLRGSDGRIEIVSGLQAGDEVVVFSED